MKDDYVALIHSENSSGDQIYKRFIPPAQKQGNNSTENYGDSLDEVVNDKVTFIGYFSQPNRIIFGSKEGCITTYNMAKSETESFSIEPDTRSSTNRIL